MAKKYLRNILYSSPLAIGEKANQTAWRYLSYPKMRMGRKKKQPPTIAGMGVGNRKPLFTVGRLANWSRHMEFKVENT